MYLRLATVFALFAFSTGLLADQPSASPSTTAVQPAIETTSGGIRALHGEWIFVEDRTEGQLPERLGPPMASKFTMSVEDGGGAVVLNGHGSGHRDVRVALDGSVTDVVEQNKKTVRYRGSWKNDVFEYTVDFGRAPGDRGIGVIRRRFQPTPEGLIVRVAVDPAADGAGSESVGLYKHAEDIALPTPAKGVIADVAWITGAWVGTRSSGSSIEERWSPPLGGAMLAVSRTVNASGKMVAFEYLRIVEREGGLVYVAQPGGTPKTEFVLTEFGPTESGGKRAVFDNPRHDYPKRIVYELSADGTLSATTGYMKGGTPRRSEYAREAATAP